MPESSARCDFCTGLSGSLDVSIQWLASQQFFGHNCMSNLLLQLIKWTLILYSWWSQSCLNDFSGLQAKIEKSAKTEDKHSITPRKWVSLLYISWEGTPNSQVRAGFHICSPAERNPQFTNDMHRSKHQSCPTVSSQREQFAASRDIFVLFNFLQQGQNTWSEAA